MDNPRLLQLVVIVGLEPASPQVLLLTLLSTRCHIYEYVHLFLRSPWEKTLCCQRDTTRIAEWSRAFGLIHCSHGKVILISRRELGQSTSHRKRQGLDNSDFPPHNGGSSALGTILTRKQLIIVNRCGWVVARSQVPWQNDALVNDRNRCCRFRKRLYQSLHVIYSIWRRIDMVRRVARYKGSIKFTRKVSRRQRGWLNRCVYWASLNNRWSWGILFT